MAILELLRYSSSKTEASGLEAMAGYHQQDCSFHGRALHALEGPQVEFSDIRETSVLLRRRAVPGDVPRTTTVVAQQFQRRYVVRIVTGF
mmetsp:Transcript_18816/g.28341  ORF Transcript_18816/g.28341 Transcript_18816/m.28341 type:complete len:90 (-) Transcript_18816:552-821(-)